MMVGPCPDAGVIPGIEEETGSSRTVICEVCSATWQDKKGFLKFFSH
jgi:hypothetical protein